MIGTAAVEKLRLQRVTLLWVDGGLSLFPFLEETLELRCTLFLAFAVVGVGAVEHACEELVFRCALVDSALLSIVVEFRAFLAFKEEEVDLTV